MVLEGLVKRLRQRERRLLDADAARFVQYWIEGHRKHKPTYFKSLDLEIKLDPNQLFIDMGPSRDFITSSRNIEHYLGMYIGEEIPSSVSCPEAFIGREHLLKGCQFLSLRIDERKRRETRPKYVGIIRYTKDENPDIALFDRANGETQALDFFRRLAVLEERIEERIGRGIDLSSLDPITRSYVGSIYAIHGKPKARKIIDEIRSQRMAYSGKLIEAERIVYD